jgi:ribose transport system permease protein
MTTESPQTLAAPSDVSPGPQPVESPSGSRFKLGVERFGLIGVWALVIVIFGAIEPNTFLTKANFVTVFSSQAVLLVLTLGLLIPMAAGDFDLSVAPVLGFSAMLIAVLNGEGHISIWLCMPLVLVLGALIGLFNGYVTVRFAINPFIVTLGTGTALQGVTLLISSSNTIGGVSKGLVNAVIVDKLWSMPLVFFYGLIVCALVWYVLTWTPVGRKVGFVGGSRMVARLSGVRVTRVRIGAMMCAGVLSALAGILYVGQSGSADPTAGQSLLLPAFAGVFLGATCIVPGRINVWGSFIAIYFLITGVTGLELHGVSESIQPIFYGVVVIGAVVLRQVLRRQSITDDEET